MRKQNMAGYSDFFKFDNGCVGLCCAFVIQHLCISPFHDDIQRHRLRVGRRRISDKTGKSDFTYAHRGEDLPWDYHDYQIDIDNALLKGEIARIKYAYENPEDY